MGAGPGIILQNAHFMNKMRQINEIFEFGAKSAKWPFILAEKMLQCTYDACCIRRYS
jgi:hypothetical protein